MITEINNFIFKIVYDFEDSKEIYANLKFSDTKNKFGIVTKSLQHDSLWGIEESENLLADLEKCKEALKTLEKEGYKDLIF